MLLNCAVYTLRAGQSLAEMLGQRENACRGRAKHYTASVKVCKTARNRKRNTDRYTNNRKIWSKMTRDSGERTSNVVKIFGRSGSIWRVDLVYDATFCLTETEKRRASPLRNKAFRWSPPFC